MLRRWYVLKSLRSLLRQSKKLNYVLDAGFGEGQFLFPAALKHKSVQFMGVDRLADNIAFGNKLINHLHIKNCSLIQSSLESLQVSTPVDVILCVGVLQYTDDDVLVLQKLHDALNTDGTLLLYVPINQTIYTRFYQYLQQKFTHYDEVQQKKQQYTTHSITQKLNQAQFNITYTALTNDKYGALAHELYNSFLLLIFNTNLLSSILFTAVLLFIYPIILGLMIIDYFSNNKKGNGILILAQKNK